MLDRHLEGAPHPPPGFELPLDRVDDLVRAVWERLTSSMDAESAAALLESTRAALVAEHPVLETISVRPTGVDLSTLEADLEKFDAHVPFEAVLAWMERLFATVDGGDVLARQVAGELDACAAAAVAPETRDQADMPQTVK